MKRFFTAYSRLTKTGIIVFSILSALTGYAISFRLGQAFDPLEVVILCLGLYFVAGGGFAINQAQEWEHDARMDRTKKRPIPTGLVSPIQGYLLGLFMCATGLGLLFLLGPWPAGIALITLVLYNVVYTLHWKRRWVFGAVPGAVPGALPVVIGFSVNSSELWRPECIYLFLVMFLWQMPHFWSLAIRYRDDYAKGGFPVLPVSLGVRKSLFHIGLYLFAYVGVALTAPFFVRAHFLYLLLVLPISAKVIWEFFKYFESQDTNKAWLPFFLWTNLSLLVYLAAPVMDKWLYWSLNLT